MYICKYVGTLIHIYVDMYIYIQSISTGFSGYKSLRPIYLHKFWSPINNYGVNLTFISYIISIHD